MPLTSFVTSMATKAQEALNQQLAPSGRPASPDAANQPSANAAASQGGGSQRSHAFESLQHQLRSFQQQYANTTPAQKIITSQKGLAIDFDSASRDAKAQSKELYTWGQTEAEDLKDVTDRLAYLNFIHGSLASSLAVKLDSSRAPLKALRDAENALAPRRNVRAGLKTQLARIEHDQPSGSAKKIAELKEQLKKAEADDSAQEKEIDLLKRKGVRESEKIKWDAMREYGEKLVLLSQAASQVIDVLPTVPPTAEHPYQGTEATGATRASLQRALDSYTPGRTTLAPAGADLSRHETRKFGETHAQELSNINTSDVSQGTSIPITPPPGKTHETAHTSSSALHADSAASPAPINPAHLNQTPAPIPSNPNLTSQESLASPVPQTAGSSASIPVADPSKPLATNQPTMAETGVPVSTGGAASGPASGSLKDLHSDKPFETAEQEKKRLAEYSSAATGTHPETAEEEKKRLEREERERVAQVAGGSGIPPKKDGDDDLPPYQEM